METCSQVSRLYPHHHNCLVRPVLRFLGCSLAPSLSGQWLCCIFQSFCQHCLLAATSLSLKVCTFPPSHSHFSGIPEGEGEWR